MAPSDVKKLRLKRPATPVQTTIDAPSIDAIRADLVAARDHLDAAQSALSSLIGIELRPKRTYTRSTRPRGAYHLPGIDANPALAQFVTERIDTMTFAELAAACHATFGPMRGISTSALYRWWKKRQAAEK